MTNAFPPLPDQFERDRFCQELDTNFSVIAPAGVGKTTSIVARVVAIAEADRYRPEQAVLPRLVVVTYTKKAADEMFSRVRTALDAVRPHPQVHAHLAQAFFGTIHSFCQKLLAVAGPLCGIPGEVEIVTDTGRLWQQFRLDESGVFPPLSPDLRKAFALHGKWEDVFHLAEIWPGGISTELPFPGLPPRVDGSPVLTLEPKGTGKTRDNLLLSQERLMRYLKELEHQIERSDPLPCPEPKMAGTAQPLKEAWQEVFSPLRAWRAEATRSIAAAVARNYARYRRRTGQFTFDDLIHFAEHLLDQPEACEMLRRRRWRVILDEAQDTDPSQFVVLTELTREPGAAGRWLDGAEGGPLPGHFSMVGDPQQSIYSDRADLVRYLRVHDRLIAAGGDQLTFSVTMRCPVAVVNALNSTCDKVLRCGIEPSRQVDYVSLANPDGACSGQVVRVALDPPAPATESKAPLRQAHYARAFAEWWKDKKPSDFGTDSWNKVAILCPRNGWIDAIGSALQSVDLPIRQLSRRAVKSGDPIHAWYAALLTVFAHPRDNFELYGVLRDIFGISDHSLALYINNHYKAGSTHPFRLDQMPVESTSSVGSVLAFLHVLWKEVEGLALYEAVETILEKCQIRKRLEFVPGFSIENINTCYDLFRRETAVAESKQLDLTAWASRQRTALDETMEGEERIDDSITLLTTHKSKGLGFDVVVLPFFFRKFSTRNEEYPCFELGHAGTPRVLFDVSDRSDAAKEITARRRIELHERLLYVALTRVKRTLVLMDDADWWSDLKRQTGESWAQLLQVEDEESPNRREWLRWPKSLQILSDPIEENIGCREKFDTFNEAEISVNQRIAPFWKRKTPSSLQLHSVEYARAEPDALTDERFPEEARLLYQWDPAAYGNWWHDLMEVAPWSDDLDAFSLHCREGLEKCPDRDRGMKEIDLLLSSSMLSLLLNRTWEIHSEVPFIWGDASDKTGYEGYIDLLAVNRSEGKWIVLDWKTDRMAGEDKIAALRLAYAPQVEIYRRAAADLFEGTGKVGLYSTVSGEWVEV